MANYIIEVSHTDPECLQGLKTIEDWGMGLLHHAWFGCAVGIHTSWLQIEVDSEIEALGVFPPVVRKFARVVEVQKLTPDMIRDLH